MSVNTCIVCDQIIPERRMLCPLCDAVSNPLEKILIKDIVIPAGTVFKRAPNQTNRCDTHIEAIVGLTKDTAGSFVYPLVDDLDALSEYFSDVPDTVALRQRANKIHEKIRWLHDKEWHSGRASRYPLPNTVYLPKSDYDVLEKYYREHLFPYHVVDTIPYYMGMKVIVVMADKISLAYVDRTVEDGRDDGR